MAYHSQSSLPAPNRDECSSLAVSFANLLQKFNIEKDPISIRHQLVTDNEPLDWSSLTAIDPRLMPTSVGSHGDWPTNEYTVIRYTHFQENSQPINHYCVVDNPETRTIIDSKDGQIQRSEVYGEPVAWASYMVEMDEDDPVDDVFIPELQPTAVTRTGVSYKVMLHENIYMIATRYKLTVDEILQHNAIKSPQLVVPGTYIYLPIAATERGNRPISYDIYPTPKPMHVTFPGGATKWSFGNVRSWKNIRPSGQRYPQNHNLLIVATAHVPIEDDTAAYHMDALSFGDYRTTGMVRYTTGFNWQHLADGHVYAEYNPDALLDNEMVENIEAVIAAAPAPEVPALPAPEPLPETTVSPEPVPVPEPDFKASYRPLVPGPVKYQAIESIVVHDAEGKRSPRPLKADQPVKVAGTFQIGDTVYGLAAGAIKDGQITSWYKIPMDNLYIEDDLYNVNVTLPEKVARRNHLSFDEKMTVFGAKQMAKMERFKALVRRKK